MKIPILRIGKTLLTSIQVDLTDNDVMQFQNDLVNALSNTNATGVIIDISSQEIVDSFMARVINDTASMARLLGAEVVITGIQPFVAMTLVEMGRCLIDADCAFNLQQGLKIIESRVAQRGDASLNDEDDDAAYSND